MVTFQILPAPRVEMGEELTLERVIRSAFTYRRKSLGRALQLGGFPSQRIREALDASGIPPGTRGEALDLEEFCSLARLLGLK